MDHIAKDNLKRDLLWLLKRHGLIGMAVGYAWADSPPGDRSGVKMGGISATLVSEQTSCKREDVANKVKDAMELWLVDNRLRESN